MDFFSALEQYETADKIVAGDKTAAQARHVLENAEVDLLLENATNLAENVYHCSAEFKQMVQMQKEFKSAAGMGYNLLSGQALYAARAVAAPTKASSTTTR